MARSLKMVNEPNTTVQETTTDNSVVIDSSEKKKKNLEMTWYKIKNLNETYYTPFSSTVKTHFKVIGDGINPPTPKELAEYFNTPGNLGAYNKDYGLVIENKKMEPVNPPIKLPAGCYTYAKNCLFPLKLRSDAVLELSSSYSLLKKDIEDFLENEDVYSNNKLIHKLGILLYGHPGNGKTSSIRAVLRNIKDELEPVAIFVGSQFPTDAFIRKINSSLKNRLKFFIFEELTEALRESQGFIGQMLDFLDGERSPSKCIVLATTNFPHVLPKSIVDRPSRFDKLYEFKEPDDEERKVILNYFLHKDITQAEISLTKGLSIAALKEACLSVTVGKHTLEEAVKALKHRTELCERVFQKAKESHVGFGLTGKS